MSSAVDTVASFYTAIEQGRHGDALAGLLAPDAVTIERPNALVPGGRVSDRAAMIAASSAGAGLLSSQQYDVHWIQEVGDTVAVRLTWRGVVAQDAGPFLTGQELVAHIAQFVRVRDGLIAEIETYDCYEPFAS
ncbi:nuclear transport factor 2 family protein [Nocardioides silvaticus]|uniref:Nuclear transport factor 2 family protein n=1 Tax=Nocardioides silvaticus TaxID=2201891 RepID=A0A316TI12_9ACTN|nr:nuclear transport factor 2 family protein [Nocardioides silvaticus]PWN04223.1 nuclear transport factor 2 family protein [Nocardioides silvaticus]